MGVDFAIIGAQKAATSYLQAALRANAAVYMPPGESAFFEDPDYSMRQWESLSDPTGRASRAGIKRPDLLCRVDQIERVAEHLPDARFITVLREPIARAVSAYYHLVRHAHIPYAPLNTGLRRALDAHASGPTYSPLQSVIRYGLYGTHLQKWFDRYPTSRFLVLSQSLVASNAARAVQLCEAHLDVPAAPAEVELSRENVGLYDRRFLRLAQGGHRLRTRRIAGTSRREPSRNALTRVLGNGVVFVAEKLADPGARPEPVAPDVRASLEDIFSTDLTLLKQLIPAEAIDWSYGDRSGDKIA